MTQMLREIQAADMLGYQEMRDFRAALRAGTVPKPTRTLGIGRRSVSVWSKRILLDWIDNQQGESHRSIDDDISELA